MHEIDDFGKVTTKQKLQQNKFILHLVALKLVLALIDYRNQEKSQVLQNFDFLDRDTTEIYCETKIGARRFVRMA